MGEGERLGAALMTRATISSLPLCGGDVSFNVLPSHRPIRSHVAPGRARPLTGGECRTEPDGGGRRHRFLPVSPHKHAPPTKRPPVPPTVKLIELAMRRRGDQQPAQGGERGRACIRSYI